MSHNDNIRLLLNIKDTNITFNEENWIQERNIKGIDVKVFTGTLTYKPKACPKCGCVNDHSIVKDGFMTSRITWLRQSNTPTKLEL
ncbi:ISL3 family transposase, partial [Aerococcus viridans]|nr:ISL3 family transposase [Aerococcus viridans]